MMVNPRKIVLDALLKVNVDQGFSNIVLDEALKNSGLSGADTALVSAIFYGVLERKITLDYCIANYLDKKKKISHIVSELLRIGAYQILFMDRIPDSAAVNESVNLIKNSIDYRAAGLVNAVLRNISKEKEVLLTLPEDTEEQISGKYSAPVWLVHNLISDYGRQNAVDFLKTSLEVPPVYIRVNTLKISVDELKERLVAQGIKTEDTILKTAIKLEKPGSIEMNPLFTEGLFFTEDLSSQLCVEILAPREGEAILDLCAAPGGKSFATAIKMNNKGRIISCDLYESRCNLIDAGKMRLGINIIETVVNDGTKSVPEGMFDCVLCDVPCSGIGIIRRKPDIKYKNPDNLKVLPALGLSILENGASAVKCGGRLVYSTCTLRKSENQKVVKRFLNAHPEFKQENISIKNVTSVTDDGCLTFMPQLGGTDGFFIASFVKLKNPG